MNIAILGYGVQGQSAGEYWHDKGADITICDQKTDIEAPDWAKTKLGDGYLHDLDEFDVIVRSPLIHPSMIVAANSPEILDKVTSTTNEFFKVCPNKNIIGVTGTKGKGTTSTLITKMLESAGKRVHLGGNIGLDPLQLLKNDIQPDDWVVLELANFQLIDLKQSPKIGVCVMVVPEHLDWHEDMEEYIAAKQQLFINQTEDDIAIYYADNENSASIADASEGVLIPYFEEPGSLVVNDKITIEGHEICDVSELKLLGKHNWQNICAATTAVWQITQNVDAIRQVATTFAGLPHRIELVRTLDGVRYYNDSFATGVGATVAAIEAVDGPKILILGGHDRMLDISSLAVAINRNKSSIKKILLIGQSADRIARLLKEHKIQNFEHVRDTQIVPIVEYSRSLAESGDAVVLSPGFASFGMFKNFEDRGLQYKAAVNAL